MASKDLRMAAWGRIVKDLDLSKLDAITNEISFDDIISTATSLIDGNVRGRIIVDMKS